MVFIIGYLQLKVRQCRKEERASSSCQKNELHVVFIMYLLELYKNCHIRTYPVPDTTSGIQWKLERPGYLVSFVPLNLILGM